MCHASQAAVLAASAAQAPPLTAGAALRSMPLSRPSGTRLGRRNAGNHVGVEDALAMPAELSVFAQSEHVTSRVPAAEASRPISSCARPVFDSASAPACCPDHQLVTYFTHGEHCTACFLSR